MKLIFVYNIDGNIFALIAGTAHKLTSPKNYQCRLCQLTYPVALMDKDWKKFIKSLPYESIFLHRDEFREKYPLLRNAQLPAVFIEDASGTHMLIGIDEINKAKSVTELIKIVQHFLSEPKIERAVYRCPECGLGYYDHDTAKRCESWCREHQSCNLDIIKHAVNDSEGKSN